jgi:predicted site-specific integrase-resolvase
VTPDLISQAAWAKRLGISVTTFKRWMAEGRIPAPLDLPGWPRWSRKVVDRVTSEIERSGEGRYFRTAQTSRRHRGLQSQASRFQHPQRALNGSGVSSEAVGDVHAASVAQGDETAQRNSIAGGR